MNNNISTLLDYLIMYKSHLMRNTFTCDCGSCHNKTLNDINVLIRFIKNKLSNINSKSKNFYTYELFSREDIINLYEVDDELYYKNMKNKLYDYVLQASTRDFSFEYILLKISSGVIVEVEFVFNFTPLIDLLYKHYDKPYNNTILKFLNMFEIKSYDKFQEYLDEQYNIIKIEL